MTPSPTTLYDESILANAKCNRATKLYCEPFAKCTDPSEEELQQGDTVTVRCPPEFSNDQEVWVRVLLVTPCGEVVNRFALVASCDSLDPPAFTFSDYCSFQTDRHPPHV